MSNQKKKGAHDGKVASPAAFPSPAPSSSAVVQGRVKKEAVASDASSDVKIVVTSPASVPKALGTEHPLQTPWTFFLFSKTKSVQGQHINYRAYENSLNNLGTFDTVEGFWRFYVWLRHPDQIAKDHDLYLMRHSLKPAWETFPTGGSWYVKVRRGNGVVNRLWEELTVATVGEVFAEPEVVGIAVSIRHKDDVLQVWNRDNSNPQVRLNIGEKLKTVLSLHESTTIEYKPFKASLEDGFSFRHAHQYQFAHAPATNSAVTSPAAAPAPAPAALA